MAYMIFIIASTLGDPEVFSLNVNLYVSKALSWYQSHAETMLSETMPTSKNWSNNVRAYTIGPRVIRAIRHMIESAQDNFNLSAKGLYK